MAGKESARLDWDDYFMGIAELSAQRSKDPRTQVGACIVNEKKRIVATGYNGMVSGWHDDVGTLGGADKKYYVCHAEMNAVLNKNLASLEGCRLYSTLYPCCECAKYIVQANIREVIYLEGPRHKKEYEVSQDLFIRSGVKVWPLRPKQIVKLEPTLASGSSAGVRHRPYPEIPAPPLGLSDWDV